MMKIVTRTALLIVIALATVACSGSPSNVSAGGKCLRSVQCAGGLACVGGVCTSDLSALAEAGTVPILPDGNVPDVGVVIDSGPPPDSGPMVQDSGPTIADSGNPDDGV